VHHFHYDQAGILCAEGVPLPDIAREVGTPVYVYAAATLRRHYRVFQDALDGLDSLIAYSLKANPNLSVLRLLADLGAGADVVSGGELDRALRAGIPGERIVFSGVGKTEGEIGEAVAADILQFNVESVAELEVINRVACEANRSAPIAFRVNPDVTAGGHEKIATGHRHTKFGVPIARSRELYARAREMPGIVVTGIDVHIGSQILDVAPFRTAFRAVAELAGDLRADGHDIRIIDVGGGIGVPYGDQPGLPLGTYADAVRDTLGMETRLVFEPGRLIVGNAGMLVSSVLYMKEDSERRFVILDAAMNDLLRPTLYGAHHQAFAVTKPGARASKQPCDLVGPVCESGDVFAEDALMPLLAPGDLVAFSTAGAYGAVMASEYNSRPLVPEVMVSGDRFGIIRRRPTREESLSLEVPFGAEPDTADCSP